MQQQIIFVIFLFLSDLINFRLVARRYLTRRSNALCVPISSESRNLPVDKDLYELLSLIVIAIMHINVFILVITYFVSLDLRLTVHAFTYSGLIKS